MKKMLILTIFIVSVVKLSASSSSKYDSVLAVVGSHKIYLSQFDKRFTDYIFTSGVNDNIVVRRSILNNMINEIILYNYDNNKNIFSDREYQIDKEWALRETELAFLKDREIYAKINPTDAELRQAFVHVNQKLAVRHLYAATEKEANNYYKLLKAGVSFHTLAQQAFTDSVLKKNGGYLGYFTWGDFDPAFEAAAYSLKVGEISKPVKTAYGYSIIKLLDKISKPLLTESEFVGMKDHLRKVLRIKRMKQTERAYIQKLFKNKKFLFNDKTLSNVYKMFGNIKENKIERVVKNTKSNPWLVKFNGKFYNQKYIEKQLSNIPSYHLQKINSLKRLKDVIKASIMQNKLMDIVKEKHYDKNPYMLETYKKLANSIYLYYKFGEIKKSAVVADSSIYNYYKANPQLFSTPNELNIQEIIVHNKPLADSLMNLVRNNKDYVSLVKKFSLREWSAKNNGVVGYEPLSTFGKHKKEFWQAKVGDILGPIKMNNYFGIFKIIGKKKSMLKSYNKVKNKVIKYYKNDMQSRIIIKYINKIKRNIKVTININVLANYKMAG